MRDYFRAESIALTRKQGCNWPHPRAERCLKPPQRSLRTGRPVNERYWDVSTATCPFPWPPRASRVSSPGASYGVISNTDPWVVPRSSPAVVPKRFPAVSNTNPPNGRVPGWSENACSTVSFHPPFEFGANLKTTPQPSFSQRLILPPFSVVP